MIIIIAFIVVMIIVIVIIHDRTSWPAAHHPQQDAGGHAPVLQLPRHHQGV
jgi:hypothetical protein